MLSAAFVAGLMKLVKVDSRLTKNNFHSGMRSKTPPEGYSVFVSYESSMCKTAIEHPRVPFPNASQVFFFSPALPFNAFQWLFAV